MGKIRIQILPEAMSFLHDLPTVLYEGGYKVNRTYARRYKNELLKFISNIADQPSYEVKPEFAHHFERYGRNLRYVFWKHGNTTWYVFYEQEGDVILVEHISNNWQEGQYIR